jgi:uncharacterized protein YcfL
MPCIRSSFSLATLVLCLLFVAGCGSSQKGATLKGTVILPPNVKLAANDSATLSFTPDGEGGQPFAAAINPADLSFVAAGPQGKGIAPGKYKITVNFQPYAPGQTKERAIFENINKRYDIDTSRLSCDVTADPQQSITVDLSKGTVAKQ